MEHGPRQVDVSKVPWALCLALTARLALVVPVNGAETRIRKSTDLVFSGRIVLDLGVLDFANGKGTLNGFSILSTRDEQ